MARRHHHRSGDWASIAARIDEVLRAHGAEDPLRAALHLITARLGAESVGSSEWFADPEAFAHGLAHARARWPDLDDGSPCARLGAAELARCGEVLGELSVLGGDLVALEAIFEGLVSPSSKANKGQFFTPRHVVRAMVEMVRPASGERVHDPACGPGGFLRESAALEPGCRVSGVDQDPRVVEVARVLLAVSGVRGAAQVGDSLGASPPTGGVDVVLANPPFAGDLGGDSPARFSLHGSRRAERDLLFLDHCLQILRPGGRLAIVLPHGFFGGARLGAVRRELLRRARVLAVISLGRNTFLPHTGLQACVLVAQRREARLPEPNADERIAFFVSERSGKDASGRPVVGADGRLDHDLGAFAPEVHRAFHGEVAARAVALGELVRGFVLAPERYAARAGGAGAGGVPLLELLEFAGETVRREDLGASDRVLVLDTGHAVRGAILVDAPPGSRDAVHSARRRVVAGDVLVSRLRPYLRQIAWLDKALFAVGGERNEVVVSPEFYVLRGRNGFDAAAIVPWLLSAPVQALLAAAQEGGHHPRVPRDAVAGLWVPAEVASGWKEAAARVRRSVEDIRRGYRALEG